MGETKKDLIKACRGDNALSHTIVVGIKINQLLNSGSNLLRNTQYNRAMY